ncbi:DUF3551 domain-containing protein [Bradyrhizobium sp. HKCCYLS1011]|uniref:DUF3551 domain-containing protein n=1 Tax=Bradyrhizobium sp. HKCCYLS1011 TaxID=3420733 RepID=UPI003EB6D676
MRRIVLMAATLVGAGLMGGVGSTPAAAYEYPWCVQGRGVGYPGDCSYQTYAQCQASASGRLVSCGINPVVAFARARQGLPVYIDEPFPAPRRRYHRERQYY